MVRAAVPFGIDAPFLREDGVPTTLRQLIRTPTILALVSYTCPSVCDYLLTGGAGSPTASRLNRAGTTPSSASALMSTRAQRTRSVSITYAGAELSRSPGGSRARHSSARFIPVATPSLAESPCNV